MRVDDAFGETHDISASGVYVTVPRAAVPDVQPGSIIRLELLFEQATLEGPLQVACAGAVMRVERGGFHLGIAVRITSYVFGGTARCGEGEMSGLGIDFQ